MPTGSSAMQVWLLRKDWRVAWSMKLLVLLVVLHGAGPISGHLPRSDPQPLLASFISGGPMLRSFGFTGQFLSVRTEARLLAGPPDRPSEQDSPSAIQPIVITPVPAIAVEVSLLDAGHQLPPALGHPFEARAPPTRA